MCLNENCYHRNNKGQKGSQPQISSLASPGFGERIWVKMDMDVTLRVEGTHSMETLVPGRMGTSVRSYSKTGDL